MTSIAKNPPANLFKKAPGGKKEKKWLDVLSGGVMTQSRDFNKLSRKLFPEAPEPIVPPEPAPEATTVEPVGTGTKRKRRGRDVNILAGRLMAPSAGKHILGG